MVCYSSSSSEDDLPESGSHSPDPEQLLISPSIQEQQNEADKVSQWDIVDEWDPTKDNLFESPTNENTSEIESSDEDDVAMSNEIPMVGCGRKERVTFTDGECQRMFRDAIYCKTFSPNEKSVSFLSILETVQKILEVDLLQVLKEYHGLKGWVSFKVVYKSLRTEEEFSKYLDTPTRYITNEWELGPTIKWIIEKILSRNSEMLQNHSDLQFQFVETITLKAAKYNPIAGRAYRPLPSFLAKKRSIINIKNTNEKCFGYCMAAFLLEEERVEMAKNESALSPRGRKKYTRNIARASTYDNVFERFHLNELTYPVDPLSVPTLEDKFQMRINIVSFHDDEGRARHPLYISKKNFDREIDLLYWEGHYAWIKSFSGFLSDLTKHNHKLYFCKRCFGHSNTETALKKHQIFCHQPDWCNQAFIFPEQGETLRFTNIWKGDPCPFVIYADCEAINKKIISKTGSTTIYQEQSPSSVGYKIVANVLNWDDEPVVLYHGPDCIERFMNDLLKIEKRCLALLFPETIDIFSEPKLREETKKQFDEAQTCAICHLDFSEDWFGMKYPYLDLSSGRFLGVIHRRCQAERKRRFRIPVFFHNFKGYDSHFVVRGLAVKKELKLEIIGQSMEKYLVIRWGNHLEFKDSLQFLSASLENLVISLL